MVSFSSSFNNPLLTSSIHSMMSRPSFEAFSSILCLDTIYSSLSSIGDKVLIRGAMVYLNAPMILYFMSSSQATGGGCWLVMPNFNPSIQQKAAQHHTVGYTLNHIRWLSLEPDCPKNIERKVDRLQMPNHQHESCSMGCTLCVKPRDCACMCEKPVNDPYDKND